MNEDKGILVNWAEMRQSWLRNARKMITACATPNNVFNHVRVLHNNMDYYGKIEVSTDRFTIIPDDLEMDGTIFFDAQFRGRETIIDDVKKVFQFRFNFKNEQRTPLIICVKSRDVLKKLETAVSELFGVSTDYEPNEIIMDEADEPQDAPM